MFQNMLNTIQKYDTIIHRHPRPDGGGHAKACSATVPDRETVAHMLKDLDELTGETK